MELYAAAVNNEIGAKNGAWGETLTTTGIPCATSELPSAFLRGGRSPFLCRGRAEVSQGNGSGSLAGTSDGGRSRRDLFPQKTGQVGNLAHAPEGLLTADTSWPAVDSPGGTAALRPHRRPRKIPLESFMADVLAWAQVVD